MKITNLELLVLGVVLLDLCRRGWRPDDLWLVTAAIGAAAIAFFEASTGSVLLSTISLIVAVWLALVWAKRGFNKPPGK